MLDPKKIARLVQIAMAVEPIPTKEGLTTRHQDITHTLKLEYCIFFKPKFFFFLFD